MGSKKYFFQKLTPVSNADISIYEEAIDFVFDNSDVKNVAVSGAYSAGKSSILESYKARHESVKFVHLSLAHFRTPEQENDESENPVKESILEGKILNQLIHQVSADKIPQTNFRVKKGVNAKNLILITVFASLLIGSILFLLLSSKAISLILALPDGWIKTVLSWATSPYAPIFTSMIAVVCSVVFIFALIKAQINKNIFRKISLQGNGIEIFEKQDDSYFDKYLNEVLYLFENVEADVIVFEDMDRFNASRIFERLREVNTLVNIQRKKEQGDKYAPLRFFYLLRDDIFVSKDRTKFFDYIIPIIPVVDRSNSYEQFLKHLKEGNLLDKFDQSFLQSLSLYVDDMRILKNIYNEFVVYIHRLNTTDLDWNKMMAMIAYKNLFPRDFSDLQINKGFVFTLFRKTSELIDQSLVANEKRRNEINASIAEVEKEHLQSIQEMLDMYAGKLQRERRTTAGFTESSLIRYFPKDLPDRKVIIENRTNNAKSILMDELLLVESEAIKTRTKHLRDLLTRENIDDVFSEVQMSNVVSRVNKFIDVKDSDYFSLMKYLIRNGLIDETYTDYMTYFYEDSISANDKTFLRRITDRRGAEYTFALREPKKVIESPVLRPVEFEQEEILNFDLLECLLLNDSTPKYATYLRTLISQIRATSNFNFVSKFYDTNKAKKQFVIRMNEQWPEFFSLALKGKVLLSVQIRKYSIDTLYFSNNAAIKAVDVDNCLSDYITKSSDYLEIEQPDIDKLVSGFSLIGVSFVAIDYEKSNKILFDEVYQQFLYALNFENIGLMLRKEYGIENEFDITHKNYTLVQSQADAPLAAYISDNMAVYTEIILDNCDGNISDDESIAISLLNNADVETPAKERYIELLSTVITHIVDVNEPSLWTPMIDRRIVAFSTSNFTLYFQKHGIDATLINYINNASEEFDFTTIADEFGAETAESLFDAVAICNDISTDKYGKMLADLAYCFDNFEADQIADEKFKVLINQKILQMDGNSLGFVREKYSKHLLIFIKKNLNEYLAIQTAELFKLDEALQVITWDIDDKRKIELLTLTSEPISIVEKQYTDEVNVHIISHNFASEEMPTLYLNYLQYEKETQAKIAALAIAGANEIIAYSSDVADSLLSVLLQSDAVTREQKIAIFTLAIPTQNEDTCKVHFDELNLSDLKGIFTKSSGRRNYEKSNEVTMVFDALKLHEWIYDYDNDDRNSDRYIIVKNIPRKEPEFLD